MAQKRTYRFIIAIVFAAMFCMQIFGNLFFIADYYLNTKAYAANCVNKDKPQLNCNGKCQLQKKLDTQNNSDKQNTEKKVDTLTEVLSSKSFFASIEIPFKIFTKKNYRVLNSGRPVDRTIQFFHPPGCRVFITNT